MKTSEETTELLTAMSAIAGAVEVVEKDARNKFHNYNYASEAAIKKALHKPMAEHGVTLLLSCDTPPETTELGHKIKDGNERALLQTQTRFTYRFFHKSGQWIEGSFIGTATPDKEDKAFYTAVTGAVKYLLTTAFLVPTEDDPEKEDSPGERRPPRPAVTMPDWAAPLAETACRVAGCGTIHKILDLKNFGLMPSKFDQHANGRKVWGKGDPIYKCPDCGKWTPLNKAATQETTELEAGTDDEPLPEGMTQTEIGDNG